MAYNSSTGEPIVADTRQLSRLARDIRACSPEAWKACRVALRAAGNVVLDQAKANAAFSHRIPQSGKVRVTAGGNVKVVFGGDAAPDAAAIENKGRGDVRHPVFGRSTAWTSKNSKPAFLAPALDAHRDAIAEAVGTAVAHAVEVALKGGGGL